MALTLTVADMKQHLNIDAANTDDDALIQTKIDAAVDFIISYTGNDLTTCVVPGAVLEATRQIAAHFYENREASTVGMSASDLPFGVWDLLAPYRYYAF